MRNKEAAKFIWDVLDGVKSFNEEGGKGIEALDLAIKALKNERPQGKWIYLGKDEPMKVECPFCHERKCCISNYCDYCGAKMKRKTARRVEND